MNEFELFKFRDLSFILQDTLDIIYIIHSFNSLDILGSLILHAHIHTQI